MQANLTQSSSPPAPDPGCVYLVGAGPGDPGLLTLRGRECLAAADVVVFDRLVGPGLRRFAPQAEWLDAGKQPDHHAIPQDQINALLVAQARLGRSVVRLKGGDPFVFGRGGEEILALQSAGIPFEVVPGVTSAVAVPAYAGIPVTQREMAGSLAIITGHRARGGEEEVAALASAACGADTLVFLMAVSNLDTIRQALLRGGRTLDTPAAVIASGTTPRQQVVTGVLGNIVEKAANLQPPAITIIGDVVRLRESLRWFDTPTRRPLLGLRILNTRPLEYGLAARSASLDGSSFTRRLETLGADVLELPVFQLQGIPDSGLDQALHALKSAPPGQPAFDWILFTSANTVEFFWEQLRSLGFDARLLAGLRLGAVGPATADALEKHGLTADIVPPEARGIALAKALGNLRSQRLLLPRSLAADDDLPAALKAAGAAVTSLSIYKPAAIPPDPQVLQAVLNRQVDLAAFFSPSAVHSLYEHIETAAPGRAAGLLASIPAACIGPSTARALRDLDITPAVLAAEHTLDGLLAAIVAWRQAGGRA